jgi:phosphoribosylglycinamide formyltransferase-1
MSIAVFASGSGTNFESIVIQSKERQWPEPVSLLIVDRQDAQAVERAKRLGVPYRIILPSNYPDKAAYETEILQVLAAYQIKRIVLAGYMRLIGATLLQKYEGKIVNIHPSLLPAFIGKDAIERAFAYPVKVSGVTVHFIDEGMDTGPIIAQVPVALTEDDTLESFRAKIQTVEHKLYPETIYQWITGRISYAPSTD